MTEQERVDQEEFDAAVKRNGKVVLEVLAGVGVVAALIMSMVALVQSGERQETAKVAAAQPVAAKTAAVNAAPQTIDTKIVGGTKLGPDGKKHDIFTKTNFTVKVGQPVKVTIDNTDDVPHSISSPTAGVNIIAQPGVHTYTMVVKSAGRFEWYCMLPCDGDANGWAMKHPGYMSGYIVAA